MEIFLEEIMALAREAGFEGEDRKGWVQIPAGKARDLERKIYVHRPAPGRPVRKVHLSGFTVDDESFITLTGDEARAKHLGNVRAIMSIPPTDSATLESVTALIRAALGELDSAAQTAPAQEMQADEDEPPPEWDASTIAKAQLDDWMSTRIGYGSLKARGWFLGMEEACEDAEELELRLQGTAVEDLTVALERLAAYPRCAGLLDDPPDLQSTWAPLIRSWLVATASAGTSIPTRKHVRAYQRHEWGGTSGDTLLTELLPLPSPSIREWPYEALGMGSRAQYRARWLPERIKLLRSLWAASTVEPRVAIAYGSTYAKYYRQVFELGESAGVPILPEDPSWARGFTTGRNTVVLVRHPVAFGSSSERWNSLGAWLRPRLG